MKHEEITVRILPHESKDRSTYLKGRETMVQQPNRYPQISWPCILLKYCPILQNKNLAYRKSTENLVCAQYISKEVLRWCKLACVWGDCLIWIHEINFLSSKLENVSFSLFFHCFSYFYFFFLHCVYSRPSLFEHFKGPGDFEIEKVRDIKNLTKWAVFRRPNTI